MAGTAPESGRPALSSVPERGTGAVDTIGAGGFNSFWPCGSVLVSVLDATI